MAGVQMLPTTTTTDDLCPLTLEEPFGVWGPKGTWFCERKSQEGSLSTHSAHTVQLLRIYKSLYNSPIVTAGVRAPQSVNYSENVQIDR